jgi:hypothetical protein
VSCFYIFVRLGLANEVLHSSLIAKWKKTGYEKLCCLRCIQTKDMNYQGSTCICRVPKAQIRAGTVVECVHCGASLFVFTRSCVYRVFQVAGGAAPTLSLLWPSSPKIYLGFCPFVQGFIQSPRYLSAVRNACNIAALAVVFGVL